MIVVRKEVNKKQGEITDAELVALIKQKEIENQAFRKLLEKVNNLSRDGKKKNTKK